MNLSKRKKTMIFIVILISSVMSSMLSTALTTALPAIMTDLHISAATGQWLTSLYSLIMGIFVLCSAYMIKKIPTKRLFLYALGIFIIGLTINIFATSFAVMMAGRFLQAAGNGIILAVAQVALLTIYPIEKRGSIMGIYGLATGVAPIIAPTLAGIIVDYIGWRMIFVIVAVICVFALICTFIFFENVIENSSCHLDILSVILCSVAFTGITLGIGNLGSYNFLSLHIFGALILGIGAGIWFVFRQLKLTTPFLDVKIFSNYEFRIAVIGSMLMYLVMMAGTMLFPIELQSVFGYSATLSALANMPGSIASAFANPLTGKLYDKLGVKKLFVTGSFLLLVNAVAFSFFTSDTSILLISGFTVIRCLGISCIMMPLVTYSVSKLPQESVPSATSLLTSLRTVAGSIGSAVFVSIATVASYGELSVTGIQFSYKILSVLAVLLLLIALFGVKSEKKTL